MELPVTPLQSYRLVILGHSEIGILYFRTMLYLLNHFYDGAQCKNKILAMHGNSVPKVQPQDMPVQ